jgi:hypothetical protein
MASFFLARSVQILILPKENQPPNDWVIEWMIMDRQRGKNVGIIPSGWHQIKQFSSLECHHELMITSELDKENFVQEMMVHGYSKGKGKVLSLFLYTGICTI